MESHVPIAVPDLGVPDLHAVLMVFGSARPGPSDELSQSLHLAGEEVTGLRTPGPIAQGFVVHNLREGLGLAVQGGRSSGPGGPRGLLPWGSRRSVLALSRIRLLIS